MKKIATILLLALAGCIHEPKVQPPEPGYYEASTNAVMQTGFNEEQYIWETFIFSTNRVERP